MANDTNAATPRKRKAPQGPRKQAPVFLIVSVHDADGNQVALPFSADQLVIEATKDAADMLKKITSGNFDATKSVVKELELPRAAPATPSAPAAE